MSTHLSGDAAGPPSQGESTKKWQDVGPELEDSIEYRFDFDLLNPSDNEEALGKIGKYDLLSPVGHGAMGLVFRGFDVQLGRTVAIKLLNRQTSSSPTARRRFAREARAAAGIRHDNVVTIYAVEEHERCPFLVMEFVDGGTLRDLIRGERSISAVEAVRISAEISAGLAAAHAQGVIHRDIKPGNIMVEDGLTRVKLTDFGLARMAVDNVDLTSDGVVVGTPSYMSPEQVRGDEIDSRSDLFSLGCVMYALVTGHSPFHGRNSYEIVKRITDHEPRPLHDVEPKTPQFFSEIVQRLLRKDPEERYQSAAEVAHVLNQHLTIINQTPSDKLSEVLRARPRLIAAGAPAQAGRRRTRSRAMVAAMLVIASAIAFRVYTAGQRPPKQLTVSQSAPADCTSITAALERAGAGTEIVVTDDALYEGPLIFDEPDRMNGVALVATAGARISAPDNNNSVIRIRGVSDITLLGLQVEARDSQHGIEIAGECPGTIIDGIRILQSPESRLAAVYVHSAARGTAEHPVTLRNLDVTCGPVGVVIGEAPPAEPVVWVRLEYSRVMGSSRNEGVLLILRTSVQHIEVTDNVFANGRTGLNFALPTAGEAADVTIQNNTFFNLTHFFAYRDSSPDQDLTLRDNVIAQTDGLLLDAVGAAGLPAGFTKNIWEKSDTLNTADAIAVAEIVESIRFGSLDPSSKDYLKPVF